MEFSDSFDSKRLKGRNRRLYVEWSILMERFATRQDVGIQVVKCNSDGLPIEYIIEYKIRSMCGVEGVIRDDKEAYDLRGSEIEAGSQPRFAERFLMRLTLPPTYPFVDGGAQLQFVDRDAEGREVAMPWHPNIRYYGSFAGRVCLNAMDSFVELAWCVERVAKYLRYELYHSVQEPPYPEDLRVARWLNQNIDLIDWSQIGSQGEIKE